MDKAKEYLSLGHYFFSKLDAEFKDRIIFIDVTSGREWTGGQLKDKVISVAAALKDLHGFEQGTVVCISYTNSDLTLVLALAVISLGGIVASAYSKDPYPELLYLARKVEPKYLFCHANNLQWARQLETDMGYPVTAITMEQLPQAEDDTCSKDKFHFHHLYNYLLEGRNQSSNGSLHSIPARCKSLEEDICVILMSSGTTGKPKAIPVTHLNCISELLALEQRGFRQPGIRFACSASLDYVSGRLIMFGSMAVGYTSIIIDGFDPKSYLEAVQRYKINIIYIGAASFYNLITYKDIDKYDISSVKIVFPMGARVIYLKELADFFAKHPHIVQVKQGFGASELAGGAMKTMTPDEYINNAECCGQLMSGMEAKLVDPETGELVQGPNKPGMLHMRGSTMFPGYYDVELVRRGISESPFVKDASVFDTEGYYITGDLAYFNEHEELFILGRKKETMCCRAGKKVLPQELEEIIAQHGVVSKVCVLGIPNKVEKTLDCPRAFVVPDADWSRKFVDWKENNSSSEDNVAEERCKFEGTNELCRVIESDELRRTLMVDLMSFVDKRIGWEKQLTGGLVFIDDMPTLRETGKVNKSYLRSLDLDQIEVYGDRSSSGG